MKYTHKVLQLLICLLIISCSSNSSLIYGHIKVIEIESDEILLYTNESTDSPIANTVKKGTILFYSPRTESTDFIEVYTIHPKYLKKEEIHKRKYYLFRPKYRYYTAKYKLRHATIVELPYDPNKTYIRGERGGCYYINANGNKTYVSRAYCGPLYRPIKIKKPTKPKSRSYSSTCGARTKSGGFCKRKVRGGGRCWQH